MTPLPKRITDAWLCEQYACRAWRNKFCELFPDGAATNYDNLLKAALARFPMFWLAEHILDQEGLAAYREKSFKVTYWMCERLGQLNIDHGLHRITTEQFLARTERVRTAVRRAQANILAGLLRLPKERNS